MNVVVYSTDMEPITVLDIPLDILNKAATAGKVRVKISGKNSRFGEKVCELEYKELYTPGNTGVVGVLVTRQETDIMLAKPGWLPGQRGQVNYYLDRIKNLLGQRRD